ncbi:DUF1553 domain-containing protein [bacterium]|nr:DUF1553 domain-containing protein [bacterium]
MKPGALYLSLLVWFAPWTMAIAGADQPPTAVELAQRLDQLIRQYQREEKIVHSQQASDAEFVRRVYLDLVGRIPTVAEARQFLDDDATDKRSVLARELVHSGSHARHMATFWRRTWIPQADTPQFDNLTGDFESWLTLQLTSEARYDEIVRRVLTVNIEDRSPTNVIKQSGIPDSFLVASKNQPASLAANTTRAFLGLNLDCAQCHDHPFSRWTQEQFWETAAFFARPNSDQAITSDQFQIELPESNSQVSATLFTGDEVPWPDQLNQDSGRQMLADWVTDAGNPYFAKNAVNRLWAHFFGVGLVEPLDDISEDNPPLQPEILDELSDVFVKSGFDMNLLCEAMVLTESYQRTSRASVGEEDTVDPHTYARMPVRGLSGEQLYESLQTAAGMAVVRSDLDAATDRDDGGRFITRFFVEDASMAERSILQSLALMNGETTAQIVDAQKSPILRVLANAPFLSDKQRIDTLYLATLARKPDDQELEIFSTHLKRTDDKAKALGDMMWVLLNTSEFNTNH